MSTVEIIRKKRDGKTLETNEIRELIQGYTSGRIPDYQMSAWAMAVFYQGMTEKETADLTMAMVESGDQVDLSAIQGIKVDKHSTGGVGDTTTLVLAPLVAAAGVPVAKLSGRGLGHTGGTIDKLESIRGFSTELATSEFVELVNRNKVAVMGQTANLTPADKKLYALRDVTATVDSIPLIASSIMSKKIAAGADAIVLDVKTGEGAFMKDEADAVRLAQAMVAIGKHVGRKTIAVVSDMSQPLGYAVGNAVEVKEAIDTLKGNGPADLTELCLVLGTQMLVLSGEYPDSKAARQTLEELIRSGKALAKLKEFIVGQHGDPVQIDQPETLPQPGKIIPLEAEQDGIVQTIHAEEVGLCAMKLGAGRATKEDQIDHAVGILLHKKVGDSVQKGEPLASLYVNRTEALEEVKQRMRQAIPIGTTPVSAPKLIRSIVTEDGVIPL
ncbi:MULTISPECIES: pyrimidine-nucleoside phosphorylase [Thermoactinomyces]|jgi:pyrimidine-nucleoside phosphorylase|uniref:Pyrimidine-nucleoside phosphorylase n=1 Tax=Thermoactinomyces daqus TaxID=1329516 RepID=A0A7W1XA77_9BACL|nr:MULTISPECIES: pyrimidine-nucleoside phosphorylase [Thermoactinomyces]MBA4542844.1 pyrimidine-nucleoside phosphorylase [Thermoactinomyces daqus]MBH8596692.1 pyrimidine-nucleoside phosphorylase [Thermoactinomyces sp. CICC 10523]MBH8603454.1 pyrimidine-nucleoside phosphorylase [Thermoactinomyces sp. CICC 10522]MBH8606619.1 pyrimidine-nucleoside phosphorylase [Thermoactinomyces sp. CICC 10521]